MLGVLRMRRIAIGIVAVGVAVALILSATLVSQLWATQHTKTWSTNADFAEGTFQGTEADNDQVKLSATLSTFPLMWVANAGEATVSKISTTTGRELARYRTYFYGSGGPWSGAAPSAPRWTPMGTSTC